MLFDDEQRIGAVSDEPTLTEPDPLIGETIEISPGVFLQRPHQQIIGELSEADSRVRYVPADLTLIDLDGTPQETFVTIAAEPLVKRILEDFPEEDPRGLWVRGIPVSIRDEFPCFPPSKYQIYRGPYASRFEAPKTPVDNVTTILQKGYEGRFMSLNNAPIGHPESGGMPKNYMYEHTDEAVRLLQSEGQRRNADNLFPGMIVYKRQTIYTLKSVAPSDRISAIYLTDRIIDTRPKTVIRRF